MPLNPYTVILPTPSSCLHRHPAYTVILSEAKDLRFSREINIPSCKTLRFFTPFRMTVLAIQDEVVGIHDDITLKVATICVNNPNQFCRRRLRIIFRLTSSLVMPGSASWRKSASQTSTCRAMPTSGYAVNRALSRMATKPRSPQSCSSL